jgi:hypothetical protein
MDIRQGGLDLLLDPGSLRGVQFRKMRSDKLWI